jgi:hypothetical protein
MANEKTIINIMKIKISVLITFILLAIIGCKKEDNSLETKKSESFYLKGKIDDKSESWKYPEYNYQLGIVDFSELNDSISYDFKIFNNVNTISLITKAFDDKNFDSFFVAGQYNIGTDYNIVILKDGKYYRTNAKSNDVIELIRTNILSKDLINCEYRVSCNLYDNNGNFSHRLNDCYISAIFEKRQMRL